MDKEALAREIDNYLSHIKEAEGFSGNVLVARQGEIILRKSYGYKNRDRSILFRPEDQLPIGSNTKSFIALAILKLKDEGLVDLGEKISAYFKDYRYGEDISIENLLVHSSGIRDFVNYREIISLKRQDINSQTIYKRILRNNLNFRPGEKFEYSNSNYFLLGRILEKVTGQALEEYLGEIIFKPLKMKDTGIITGKNRLVSDLVPYSPMINLDLDYENTVLAAVGGAGNIYSTLDDLYLWDRALTKGELISKTSQSMMERGRLEIRKNVNSAYGFRENTGFYGHRVYHTGTTLGFTSNLTRYLDRGITIILLSNLGQYNIGRFRDNLEKIIFKGESFKGEKIGLNKKLLGTYKYRLGFKIKVYEEDGEVYVKILNLRAIRVFPEAENILRSIHTNISLVFQIENGRVKSLEVKPYKIRGKFLGK